ncbi:MAG: hypothetical protein ACQEVA_07455 [Myxococcota bacterium]
MERADPQRARRWGIAVILMLLGTASYVFFESTRETERDTQQMDRGVARLIEGLESGQRQDFVAAQKVFLDMNSGWIVDQYAAFAIQATERLRRRVVGPDENEPPTDDSTSRFYVLVADGRLDEAREWSLSRGDSDEASARTRSKYMLRFISDIERVGGEDVVERIRGR